MGQGEAEGPAGRRVPQPRRSPVLPVSTALPSGLNATEWIGPRCFREVPEGPARRRVPQPRRPVHRSRSATALPSRLNAMDVTSARCFRRSPRGRPVAVSHSRRPSYPSSLPVSTRLAVRAERHSMDAGSDASGASRWAGPSPRPTAAPYCRAPGQYGLAVGAERHGL